MDLERHIQEGLLERFEAAQDDIDNEMHEAKYDLKRADDAFDEKDYKWCIVKSYYAMFHAAKAVMFSRGYREKRHFAVSLFLEELEKGSELESTFVNDFKAAKFGREEADYRYRYSVERSNYALGIADRFVARMEQFLGKTV